MSDVAEQLTKTDDWHAERAKGLGGSDAKRVMEGDWHKLWLEKTGRQEPDDLSDVLAVQMGSWTEPLNLHWFCKQTGKHVDPGVEPVVNRAWDFMRANLDGWCSADAAVFEAKHVSGFDKPENVINRYYPQLQHCLCCTNADLAYLSVFYGNSKWEYYTIERDQAYIDELIERERAFWWHVENDQEPENPDAIATDISLDDMREVDLTGDNQWADLAATWLETREPAKRFKDSEKQIKAMVEPDVKLAHGHGIKVTRAKNAALSIRESK